MNFVNKAPNLQSTRSKSRYRLHQFTLSKRIFLVKMFENHYSNLIIYHPLLKGA